MTREALLRLDTMEFEGAGSYRSPTGSIPLSGQGRVLVSGAEGCVSFDTHVPFIVWRSDGKRQDGKSDSIERLYLRYHGIGRYAQSRRDRFTAACINEEGRVFHNDIIGVVKSGLKACLQLTTETGHRVRATADHRFWAGDQFIRAGDLEVGSTVYIHNNTRYKKPGVKRVRRPSVCVKHHPSPGRVKVVVAPTTGKGYPFKRLLKSWLAKEADMNGLSYSDYIDRLNAGRLDGLKVLPFGVHVHHIDENPLNNDPSNLEVIDPDEHNRRHAIEQHNNLRFMAVPTTIVDIADAGIQETYDIQMRSPHNNFVANGFVVHNSGKTMIPEVATLVLYSKGSPRVRKSGLAESTIVNEETGYLANLGFRSGFGASARAVNIQQAFKHKRLKSRYIITVDGKREEPTTKPEQKKLVSRLAPLSYDEWLGVVYLCQGGIHDLLAGTPTEKRQYLTSVFGLDFYEDLITEAKEEAKRLTTKAAGSVDLKQRLADVEAQLQEAKTGLDEYPTLADLQESADKLAARVSTHAQRLGVLVTVQKTLTDFQRVAKDFESIWDTDQEPADVLDQLRTECQKAQTDLAGIKAQQKAAADAEKAYALLERDVKDAKAALASAKEAYQQATQATEGLPTRKALAEASAILRRAMDSGVEKGFPSGKAAKDPKDALLQATANEQSAKALTKLLSSVKGHDHEAKCPTCQSDIDVEAMETAVRSLVESAKKQRSSVAAAYRDQFFATLGDWLTPDDGQTFAGLSRRLEDAGDAWAEAKEREEAVGDAEETLGAAADRLKRATKPAKAVDLTAQIKGLEATIIRLGPEVQKAEKAAKLSVAMAALGDHLATAGVETGTLDTQVEEVTAKKQKAEAKHKEAVAALRAVESLSSTVSALRKQKKDLETKVVEFAEHAAKLKHYEDELVPYFSALRAAKVRSCVSKLEAVLPVYVSAMSSRQYVGAEVRLTVSEDLKDIDMTLRTGRGEPEISAIQASGGQRRRFTLAIIAALREVSPRAANLMFFDEPFADLEGEGKLLFINRLIPTLMDRCPDLTSVFTVAHDAEILNAATDAFDAVWTVTKDAHGSKISMGQKLAMVEGR